MFEQFFAKFIAEVSEEVFMDVVRAIVREYAHARKKGDIKAAVADLRKVIEETATEGMTDAEKNALLIDAGRVVVGKLRDK